ncbi:M48 family metallopeptidase [Ferrimonas balearica]|uniref:M48 family metallopeptidase n=1 Tax=Ferrimonas balearica TaxID=44012 RepID=UPI001C99B929|nr:M48 family metallopeptidase [Ferrimonas balearica]MBY5994047.1 M48 family metallopeptidase [Ferrimonas balearica]
MELAGRWLDGRQSRSYPGVLRVNEAGELFRDAQGSPCGRLSELTVPARLGTMPRTLTLANGWRFECDQHERLDALANARGRKGLAWVDRLERSRHIAVVALVLVVAVFWGLYRYGVPALAAHTAQALPADLLDEASAQALRSLPFEQTELPLAQQQRIRTAFGELLRANDLPPGDFRLHLRSAPDIGPNAFALPSGDIVLLDQLVALTERDDEWLGVLAHEVVHVQGRHGLRGALQGAFGVLIMTVLTGDASAATGAVMELPRLLLERGYSRDLELEADAEGAVMMRRAGRDPLALGTLLQKLEGADNGQMPGWLRTHPVSDERVRALRAEP